MDFDKELEEAFLRYCEAEYPEGDEVEALKLENEFLRDQIETLQFQVMDLEQQREDTIAYIDSLMVN